VTLVIERTVMLCDAVLLWVILFQARSLGITWRSSVCEIALGFAMFLTVQAVSKFIFAKYSDSARLMSYADEAGQVAFLIAMGGWIWTMFHRDPLPPPPTAETLARMRTFTSDTMVTKEKMLSAVGVRINRGAPDEEMEHEELAMVHQDSETEAVAHSTFAH
jgi:hypothetical protein